MLYLTTRSKTETYTAFRTLTEDRTADGGYFLPFHLPRLEAEQISELSNQGFGQTVADILNIFFSSGLTGWDIDCAIGKTPVKILPMGHKTSLCQLWNTPTGDYAFLENAIYRLLYSEKHREPTVWARIAIGIGFLFAIGSQLLQEDIQSFDVSVADSDFLTPVSIWYAKQMGLPVGNIIYTCQEESGLWDLVNRGVLSDFPYPPGLEMYFRAVFGFAETQKLLESQKTLTYDSLEDENTAKIKEGLYISVIGRERIPLLMNNCYSSFKIALDTDSALAHGGLQDYRAKTGSSEWTLILAGSDPEKSDVKL